MSQIGQAPQEASVTPPAGALHFLWWNVESFAHSEPGRPGRRMPKDNEAYQRKQERIESVLQSLLARGSMCIAAARQHSSSG